MKSEDLFVFTLYRMLCPAWTYVFNQFLMDTLKSVDVQPFCMQRFVSASTINAVVSTQPCIIELKPL